MGPETQAAQPREIELPFPRALIPELRAGEALRLTGIMYTARDAAHARMLTALGAGEAPPSPLKDATLYYCGPTPGRPPRALGSAGPTTSSRMDKFTPALYAAGLAATVGKGQRAGAIREACREHQALYLVAPGGAGALLGSRIVDAEVVAYPELGPEAVRRIEAEDFPVWVAYDAHGGSLFPGDEELP